MGVAIFNLDMTLRLMNPKWAAYIERFRGDGEGELLTGMHVDALFLDAVEEIRPLFQKTIAGESVQVDAMPLFNGIETVYWNTQTFPLLDDDHVTGIFHLISDVTPRRETEVELEKAQQSLLTLMSSLSGMAYRGTHNKLREMELVNEGVEELTGYAPANFIVPARVPFGTLIHDEDKARIALEIDAALQKKAPFELLYRIRTATDEIKWVLERGAGLFTDGGKLIALEGFVADITERVLAQQLLEQRVVDRTRKLSALYEVMAVATEQHDLKTILQEALSWVLKAIHGCAGAIHLLDKNAQSLHLVVHESLPQELIQTLGSLPPDAGLAARILSASRPYRSADIVSDKTISAFGVADFHAYIGLPIHVRDGQAVGILSVFRDIRRGFSDGDVALSTSVADQIGTAIENAQLRRENERLLVVDERNRLARELHDAVTQSLYSLTIFAEVNQRYAQAQAFNEVLTYSRRVGEMAGNSLKEMRLLLHNLRPSILQEVGLVGALQQRLDAVEKRAGITSKLIVDDVSLPPAIEKTLYYMAEEALNNALKHAGGTAVIVEIKQNDDQIWLTVQDNGAGFDVNKLQDKGGMGLSSMKERADLCHGKLFVESSSNGTTITVCLQLDSIDEGVSSRELLDLI